VSTSFAPRAATPTYCVWKTSTGSRSSRQGAAIGTRRNGFAGAIRRGWKFAGKRLKNASASGRV
jgi:hypothetical protein